MTDVERDKIVKRFLESQNRLVFQSSDLSLESIANMVDDKAIDIAPRYQRRERWTPEKQSALIESFLMNIPVPAIYLAEDEYGKYSVIDGKQRITAVFNFIKKKQRLLNLEKFKEIEGLTFEELPTQLNNALKIRPYIRVVTLLKQSHPDLKYEVFTRLNTGGESLLPQEIRNVAYMGKLNDLIFVLAENKFLRRQLKIFKKDSNEVDKDSPAYKEMFDAEYVLRFFTLHSQWQNFSGNMRSAMDEYMMQNRNPNKAELAKQQKLFQDTMEICEQIWGKHAFMRPEGEKVRSQILQGFYDAQTVPISLLLPKHKARLLQKKAFIKAAFTKKYKNDSNFENSLRQFTSNPERVRTRIQEMLSILNDAIRQ